MLAHELTSDDGRCHLVRNTDAIPPVFCRCEVSWASCSLDSDVMPQAVWSFNEDTQVVKLERVEAVCPEVYLAKRVLQKPAGPGREAARDVLKGMNECVCLLKMHACTNLIVPVSCSDPDVDVLAMRQCRDLLT